MTRLRMVAASLAGGAGALLLAPFFRSWFHPPTVGVGFVTVHAYPKNFDYFAIALVVLGALGGGLLAGRVIEVDPGDERSGRSARRAWPWTLLVFLVMLFVHDHPYAFMDHFHDGEHLTPGVLMKRGAKPYSEVFLLHGLMTDGGLDALVLGDPPSPRRVRRTELLLDAAALAMLVPLAFELCVSGGGIAIGVLLSWSAIAGGLLPMFPWFRLLPLILASMALLRYLARGRLLYLFAGFACATAGILWSLDTGTYTVAAVAAVYVLLRLFGLEEHPPAIARVVGLAAVALALPLVVLVAVGAGVRQFLADSFVVIPRAIDAIWALPAPAVLTAAGIRFWFPPMVYGLLLAMAWWSRRQRLAAGRLLVVAVFGLLLFRSAAGRVSWSHTRFALPFIGIALVAFLLEPLWLERPRWTAVVALVPLLVLFEVGPNLIAAAKALGGWRGRQRHEGLVPYPLATGKGIYTYQADHDDLAVLNGLVTSLAGPAGTIYDFAGERALYYLLARSSPVRCLDSSWMSVPSLEAEAMAQLRAHPPACVILKGPSGLEALDGVSNRQRAPALAAWIDANYPRHLQVGRYEVASR